MRYLGVERQIAIRDFWKEVARLREIDSHPPKPGAPVCFVSTDASVLEHYERARKAKIAKNYVPKKDGSGWVLHEPDIEERGICGSV